MNPLEGKNILIVEDDALLSEMLAGKFANQKTTVDHASDGEQALTMLKDKKYDLVLLDIMLPKVDGFTVLNSINDNPASKGTPVIILSNLGQKNDVQKGLTLGVKKYLVKAILSLDEVVEASKEVLK
jgi:DNA-binding response OmpR family regulator